MARYISRVAYAWLIIVGYIAFTPFGPICIACGATNPGFIGKAAATVLGLVSFVLGIAGFALGKQLSAVGRAGFER